ncbi:MAG: hypothetical protein SFY56_05445 [Bacteroidota bacterium]|nr:hypothetical protein [Bacteroidota bacterium]
MKKKITQLVLTVLLSSSYSFIFGQGLKSDITVDKLPQEVKQVLENYITILSSSASYEDCATKFTQIAGGGLIDESLNKVTLRTATKTYSLKKDFDNIKFYANPIVIKRVSVSPSRTSGFGESAITGTIYKIFIEKKAGGVGLPAPISIMVPKNHPKIKSPKVINVGSL